MFCLVVLLKLRGWVVKRVGETSFKRPGAADAPLIQYEREWGRAEAYNP